MAMLPVANTDVSIVTGICSPHTLKSLMVRLERHSSASKQIVVYLDLWHIIWGMRSNSSLHRRAENHQNIWRPWHLSRSSLQPRGITLFILINCAMKKIIWIAISLIVGIGAKAQTIAELDSITEQLEQIGYFYEALDLLDKREELPPDLLRRKGTLLYAIGEYESSIEVLKGIVEADTTFNIKDYLLLANSYQALQIMGDAILYREAIAKEYPFNESNLVILSQLARPLGLGHTYMELLNNFLKVHPKSKPIRRELAHMLYFIEEYDASKKEFQTLYDEGDRNVNTLYYLGSLLLRDNNLISTTRASKVLTEAVEMSQGGTPIILSDLAFVKTRLKRLDEAMSLLDEADSLIYRTPEFISITAQLEERKAQVYLDRQQWKSGIKYLRRAYEIDPTNRRILYMIARSYQKINDLDNEERYLNELLKKTESDKVQDSEWAKYALSRLESIKEIRFMERK